MATIWRTSVKISGPVRYILTTFGEHVVETIVTHCEHFDFGAVQKCLTLVDLRKS